MSLPVSTHQKAAIENHVKSGRSFGAIARELGMYSVSRALEDMLDSRRSPESLGVFETSAALTEKYGTAARGLLIPLNMLASRDLSTSTLAHGGYLVQDTHSAEIAEAVRPVSVAMSLGATVVEGVGGGKLYLPSMDTDISVTWAGEGVPATPASPTFGLPVAVSRTLVAEVTVSRQLMRSGANGGFELQLRRALLGATMAELDRVILAGSGSGEEPLGLLNHPDVSIHSAGPDGDPVLEIDPAGGAPTWRLLTDMEEAVGSASGDKEGLAFVSNSAVRRTLRNTTLGAGLDFIMPGQDLLGYSARFTESLPSNLTKGADTNLSPIIAGNFSEVLVAFFGAPAVDVLINPYQPGAVKITAFLDVGIVIRRPTSFAVCKDLVTL